MLNVKRAQWALGLVLGLMAGVVLSQETGKKKSSYAPVVIEKDFATVMAEMKAAKPELGEAAFGIARRAVHPN